MFVHRVGKYMKKLRVKLLGPRSSFGCKKPEVGLLERPKTNIRRDIKINLDEKVMKSLDNMKPNAIIKALVEFSSKTLVFSYRVNDLLLKELKDSDKAKMVEDLSLLQAKYDDDKGEVSRL